MNIKNKIRKLIEDKKILINNKIFIVFIVFLIILTFFNIFKKFGDPVILISGLFSLIIYVIAIMGLMKNNKNLAWILGGLPSLWSLFNPLPLPVNSYYQYGYFLFLFKALMSGDPITAAIVMTQMFIPVVVILFVIVNLVLFKIPKDTRSKKESPKKRKRVVAIAIAIFFSYFVWLYLRKYKLFFVLLGITVGSIVLESLLPLFGGSMFIFDVIFIRMVFFLIVWMFAISYAWKLKD